MQFQQPHAHKGQVAGHAFAVSQLGAVDDVKEGRTADFNFLNPILFQVAESPDVVKLGAPRFAVQRGGVRLVGVERRVQVDEVNALGVDAPEDVQVVPGKDGAVGHIANVVGHSVRPSQRRGGGPAADAGQSSSWRRPGTRRRPASKAAFREQSSILPGASRHRRLPRRRAGKGDTGAAVAVTGPGFGAKIDAVNASLTGALTGC